MEVMVTETMANPLARDLDETLDRHRAMWQELRGARVFATGATGFFGAWLMETFLWANDRLELGASLVALTRDPRAFERRAPHLAQHPAVTLHEGDARTFEFVDGPFSHVIHAATDSSSTRAQDDRLALFDTIVAGTRRALEFARASGAERFLLTSSGAVYGRQPPEVTHVPEDYAGAPDPAVAGNAYGEGKRAAEMLCGLYASGQLRPTIARCFAFVGPHLPLDQHFAVGNFIRDALDGGPIHIAGDGTPFRSYLYAADLAAWLWTILLRGQPMRPYNVGSEAAVSIADLAAAVAHAAGGNVPVHVAQRPSGAPPQRYVPSTARARHELGLDVSVDLHAAIARTLSWHIGRTASHVKH